MKKLLVIIIIVLSGTLCAQELSPVLLSNSGGYYSNTSASLSWSLGEIAIETIGNASTTLTQGFQQYFDITTVINALENNYEISVYPNPFTDYFFVKAVSSETFYISIIELSGKTLIEPVKCTGTNRVDISSYPAGVYLLIISDSNNAKTQSFRIIKQ